MLFNVSQLLREGVGATRRYTLAPELPVHQGAVELVRTPQGVLVRANVDVVEDAVCSRCVVPFGYPLHLQFEEVFVQLYDVQTGARLDVDRDLDSFTIDDHHTIDITEAVRQYSEMAAALQPLCREDCPGLCVVCGQDLSVRQCGCETTRSDPRWAALEALKTRSGG